jgi:hypothetical protein
VFDQEYVFPIHCIPSAPIAWEERCNHEGFREIATAKNECEPRNVLRWAVLDLALRTGPMAGG